MADCNDLFSQFNSIIRLTDSKRENLRNTRNVLRERIENYFKTNDPDNTPKFHSQGSYVMDTIINPIEEDYDLDDGVYFIGELSKEQRAHPVEVHRWVMKAIGDHTDKVVDKNACIRVVYSNGWHIDLPMYYYNSDPELAHKTEGWILSNPVEFIAWFEEQTGSGFKTEYILEESKTDDYFKWLEDIRKSDVQLRRIVRYMKAWGDFKKEEMPSGLILTILSTNDYYTSGRDDYSLYKTLEGIHATLSKDFVCKRPTTPKGEDLFAGYSETRKKYFLNALKAFLESASDAIDNPDKKEACLKWQKHLGPRFSCNSVSSSTIAASFSSPDVIKGDAKSA